MITVNADYFNELYNLNDRDNARMRQYLTLMRPAINIKCSSGLINDVSVKILKAFKVRLEAAKEKYPYTLQRLKDLVVTDDTKKPKSDDEKLDMFFRILDKLMTACNDMKTTGGARFRRTRNRRTNLKRRRNTRKH
jgi:hypothetical protein